MTTVKVIVATTRARCWNCGTIVDIGGGFSMHGARYIDDPPCPVCKGTWLEPIKPRLSDIVCSYCGKAPCVCGANDNTLRGKKGFE